MFPLIALGALFAGGLAAKEALDGASDTKASSRQSKSVSSGDIARPQSYLITPVSGSQQPPQVVSALDAVRNFIV